MSVSITIRGIQEAQRANLKAIAALSPDGSFGEAIRYGTLAAHRYSVAITHVITGALRASHRVAIKQRGLRGVISIDPSSVRPKSKARPFIYGPYEHARGGSHAFYERVVRERGAEIGTQMIAIVRRGLP